MDNQYQKQHLISKVYWKQFGYIDESNRNRISVFQKATKQIKNLNIESFNTEINVFDLPFDDEAKAKGFELMNGKLESRYNSILDEIYATGAIVEPSLSLLIQFIANLNCRTKPYRQLISNFLNSIHREKFLRAICVFQEDKGESFIRNMNQLKLEFQLNPVSLAMMEHIMEKLTTFDFVILRDFGNRGWITSDIPVVLENSLNYNSVFSIDTIGYFPLSKDFCLCFFHSNSKKRTPLFDGYRKNVLHDIDEEVQETIYAKIRLNAFDFIVFPVRLNHENLVEN